MLNNLFEEQGFAERLDATADKIMSELLAQYDQKNLAYGNNAHQGFLRYGPISYVIRIEDKLNRLETLWENPDAADGGERIEDTLGDAITYCFMFIGSLVETCYSAEWFDNQDATRQCFKRNAIAKGGFSKEFSHVIRDYDDRELMDFSYDESMVIRAMRLMKNCPPEKYSEPVFALAYRLCFLMALLRMGHPRAKDLCDTFFVRPKGYKNRFDYWTQNGRDKEEA